MRVGIITGSGTYSLPELEAGEPEDVETEWGATRITRGTFAGVDVVHVSRHGEGHVRLSNHVGHRANVAALKDAGCDAVVAVTVCGAVDPGVELGSLVVFDDLHFVSNRLADGSLCTFHDTPGHKARAHWIFEDPFAPPVRRALLEGSRAAGVAVRDSGCYGHVDGPRFNTKAEIRGLAACGVTAVSQTAGPETVLAGEAGIPFALLGYATDYANGVQDVATPVEELIRLIGASPDAFAAVLTHAVGHLLAAGPPEPVGTHFRFD